MSWKKNLTITTILAGTTAIGIHLINKAIYVSATLDNLLSHTPENYYDWKFGKIFYRKAGNGKPILLIHDLSSYSSSYEWSYMIDELSKPELYMLWICLDAEDQINLLLPIPIFSMYK